MGYSWESWYLDFEEMNLLLDIPVPIKPKDMTTLKECHARGITPEEALENFVEWT